MENDLKIFFTVSIVIHVSVFAAFGLRPKRAAFVVLPIDLLMNSGPQLDAASAPKAALKNLPAEPKKKKEKEIVVPKKRVKEELPAPKKAEQEQKEEPKSAAQAENPGRAAAQGFTGGISVDAVRFPYAYYTNLIVRKIGRYWQWSNEFGQLRTVVYFKINKGGDISEVSIKDSSGDSLFDDQALRAIKLAGPFPPLPEGYPDNDLGVYFEFTYRE